MKQLTLGSLFDGIGGFCYAAGIPSGIDTGCTIKPLWAAEVEPNCIDITRYRFKDVMHVGSVTELKGDEIQPVDIITFGSPCQDLSIAGKRKGLKGKTYDKLTFNFEGLLGSDMIAVENEMAAVGEYVLSPEISTSFLSKMAARAAGVGSDLIEHLPIRDFGKIKNKSRDFLVTTGLSD